MKGRLIRPFLFYLCFMMQLSKPRRFLFSILSGVFMVIAFPYTGSITPLVFISWVPLLLIEETIATRNYRSRKVFTHALITFFIFNIGTTWWVWFASPIGALLAFILNTLFMAIIFQGYHWTKKFVGRKEGFMALIFFWISFEYIHYQWELSWPWIQFGNFFSILPSWVQWYSYTGILGGTFWVLLINIMVFRIVYNVYFKGESKKIQTPLYIVLFASLFIPLFTSLFTYYTYEEKMDPLQIVLVQPNIDPYNEKFSDPVHLQIKKLCDLAESKIDQNTDIVVAPETAISRGFYEEDAAMIDYVRYLVDKKKTWKVPTLLIGASTAKVFETKNSRASRKIHDGPGYVEYYNTSMMIDEANELSFIHKSLLVPGVEIIPFSYYFPFLEELSIENGGTSGSLGIEKQPKTFTSGDLTFSSMICYESIWGDMLSQQCRQGAEAVFVITNDGWWRDTPGYKQHMSFSRLRAIESRRYVSRSANTGISCIINQRGDVVQQAGWWVPAVIKGEIQKNREATFYSTYGDVMGRSFSFVSVLLILLTFVRYFKKKYMK
jgi:apolipoprotein N-acyltransferase